MKYISSHRSLVALGLALSLGFVAASCSSKKVSAPVRSASNEPNSGNGEPGNDDGTKPVNKPERNKVEALSSSIGLMNFRQLTATYSQLTGVTLANAAVKGEYDKQLASLPREYGPAQISAAKVAAATKLAAQYCDVLSTTPALLTTKFPGLSLAAAPADSAAYAKTLLEGFYGPEHSLQGNRATDITSVAAAVDGFKALNGTGPAVFMASCAAILAGAEFYLY